MKFEDVYAIVGNVPFISEGNARRLYQMIIDRQISNVLELGMAHGTATCIMAAALQENGGGLVTSVDLLEVKEHFKPSPEEQLGQAGLTDFVKIHRMKTGYTWFLHDEIVRNTRQNVCKQIYDLCIIDGPKNWTIDGAAFFMADKLLKKKGVLVFDDYRWTYAHSAKTRAITDGICHRELSVAELITPQIKEVFELLVRQHPNYGNFTLVADSDWAMAEKIAVDHSA
jgi:predicted O-methyltransferase YrrM